MLFPLSGFDVSRASWEFPEGTCAGYNGELKMFMMVIMMTKTMMLMMSMTMTMTVMMTMMMLILVLIHNSKKLLLTPWAQLPMGLSAQFYFKDFLFIPLILYHTLFVS